MGSKKSDKDTFMKFLAIIGAILVVIVAIIFFVSFSLINIAFGIIWFVIGLIILMSCFKPNNPVPYNEAFILIMGIIVLVLSFVIGGGYWIVALIAGIIILIGGFIGMLT